MSNEMVVCGSGDSPARLKGYKKFFRSYPNHVTRTGSDVLFFAWQSVEMSCRGWDLGGFHCEKVELIVEYDGEMMYPPLEYISIDQIAKLAMVDPRALEYVDWTTRVDLEIPRRAQTHPYDIENDKDVLVVKGLGEMVKGIELAVRNAANARHLAEETARRQTLVELHQKAADTKLAVVAEQSADAKRASDYATEMARETEYMFVIPWLYDHGVRVPDAFWGTVGTEIRRIANEDGFYPKEEHKRAHKGYATHRYPPIQMDKYGGIWIERNRQRPERIAWFRKPR